MRKLTDRDKIRAEAFEEIAAYLDGYDPQFRKGLDLKGFKFGVGYGLSYAAEMIRGHAMTDIGKPFRAP